VCSSDLVPAGHVLCRSGELLDRLLIITEGNAVIRVDGEAVAQVGAGQFIGEMSYLTRALASADVETTEPTRYLGWRSESLRAFLEKNSELRAALQMVLSSDLAQKLKG
jgi:CRP-like cAMP-binding protein